MKKMISFATAMTLAAAIAAPISVFAADTPENHTITQGVNSDTPNRDTAETSVEFDVNPGYTITIPAKVELTGEYGKNYSNSGTVSAENVFLNEGKKIVVTLTSESKFNMETKATDATYKLPYTATGNYGAVPKETGGKVAEFVTSTTKQDVTVTFTTDQTPTYAGKYSDPVVFTISIDTGAVTPTNTDADAGTN